MIIIPKLKKRGYAPSSIAWAFFYMLLVFLLFYFLKSPALAAASVRTSLNICATGLIPSLFPFIVLVSMINMSGAASHISNIVGTPISRIFKLGKNTASAVLLGVLGGFPIGAVCARALYERGEISKSDAARLIAFTNNASPAFCIGTVGISLFGDVRFGVHLYFCQLAAAFIIGMLGKGRQTEPLNHSSPPHSKSLSDVACAAISEGGVTMLKICSFAVFFAVVGDCMCLVISHFFGSTAAAVCVSFVELTLAAGKCAALGTDTARIFCAFAVGFSGLSVHMQTASVLSSSGIPMKRYYISKLFQGILSSLFMALIYSISPT